MKEILLKNAIIVSPINNLVYEKKDILIKNGKISKIAENLNGENVVNCESCIVTPGFIDIHTHCYPDASIGLNPDMIGVNQGVTTIFDAGSAGANNFKEFYEECICKSKTKIFSLLNVSNVGLCEAHELANLGNINNLKTKKIISEYSEYIVGLKARASQSVVKNQGITPIVIACDLAKEVNLPLMIHIGNQPPKLEEVLDLMNKNDIVTHAFNGKEEGIIEKLSNKIKDEARNAKERGVLFDIGHGSASFSAEVYKNSKKLGIETEFISSDLHIGNINGPVFSFVEVLNKMLACGDDFEGIVKKITSDVAKHFKLKQIGEIKEGYIADLNILKIEPCTRESRDSEGNVIKLDKEINILKTIYSRGDESAVVDGFKVK